MAGNSGVPVSFLVFFFSSQFIIIVVTETDFFKSKSKRTGLTNLHLAESSLKTERSLSSCFREHNLRCETLSITKLNSQFSEGLLTITE